jgi:hypothetical protein
VAILLKERNGKVEMLGLSHFLNGSLVLAYIDAGTGSLIVQCIIGGLAGALLALKLLWGKIRRFFRKSIPSEKETSDIRVRSKNEQTK